ncbi:hypothetical protein [Novosphingobium guangzhouense]|uniref:Uncharacterized protein n=1 Tax=Novosphingobium guangzhouense TaxID=1850347 RepID=A0A2K2G237_9SPHN|nr:hypothetical protein [Novosphingobium guangzhouense]PNU05097.1 hypothetical protein A8V01_04555 [Novosphingobium guangzhouense]
MARHVSHRCALALLVTAAPAPVFAEQPAPLAMNPRPFDLTAVPTTNARKALRSQTVGEVELLKPEKTRLKLTYQTDDDGPSFEIGTIGSRKGAMKSRLVHVAMDWIF